MRAWASRSWRAERLLREFTRCVMVLLDRPCFAPTLPRGCAR